MLTVVHFIPRSSDRVRAGMIPLVARTCGKLGLIDESWQPSESVPAPKEKELWLVDITRETRIGENRGNFILVPIRRVERKEVSYLLPGFYTEHQPNNATLIITPSIQKPGDTQLWMLPLNLRRELVNKMGLAALVVNLGGDLWFKPASKEPPVTTEQTHEPDRT